MQSFDSALNALKQQHASDCSAAATSARVQTAADLNHIARRLRDYETENDWSAALIDGAALFASETALFVVEGQTLRLRTSKEMRLSAGLSFALSAAQAFANAVASKELVVALRTPGEVGPSLASEDLAARSFLFPVQNSERVAAILFASGNPGPEVQGLELISLLGSLVLSRRRKESGPLHSADITAAAPRVSPPMELPPWSALNEEQRNRHLRAQRFARVRVAELQLAKAEAFQAGLEQNDIYLFLKSEIDAARELYGAQFMGDGPMIDYLHLELVHTAAEGDEAKLGEEYPGPLD